MAAKNVKSGNTEKRKTKITVDSNIPDTDVFCTSCMMVSLVDSNNKPIFDDWQEGEYGLLCPDCLKSEIESDRGANSSITSVLLKALDPTLTLDQIDNIEGVLNDKKK